MTELKAAFAKPFAHQIAASWIRLGDLRATTGWKDVWQSEHDRAFMVAGAQKAELLADLAAAIDKAISKGTTLDEFRKDFSRAVQDHDWHGWTGEETEKGRAWRTRVIYRTNLLTSYAAGRLAQLKEGKFSHWVYRHGNSRELRIQHLHWDGLVLPPDHPFWATHYPPNGWFCSCYVIGARSEAGAKRRGGKPEVTLDDGWQTPLPKTGAPEGIDKGWAYAPGATVSDTITALRPKLESLPPELSIDLIQSWVRSHVFENWTKHLHGNFPLARLSDADALTLGSSQKVAMLSPESWQKQLDHHPELTPADYALAQKVVSNPTARVQEDARHLIFIQEGASESGYVLVVKAVIEMGELFVVSFRRLSSGEARSDREVARLLRKGS